MKPLPGAVALVGLAMVIIGGLDAYALSLGHNGTLLAGTAATIAALAAGAAGFHLGRN